MDITINESDNLLIEHVSIDVSFQADRLKDMEIYLTSPGGTRVQMIADTGDSGIYNSRWKFGTTAFMGETSAGNWSVNIVDDNVGKSLIVRDVDLYTSGAPLNLEDLFIFTNEYSDYAGTAGHSTSISGGLATDTLNAAAVTAGNTINLNAGTGSIDGVAVTISGIEKVYSGDGNDVLTEHEVGAQSLDAGRGNDTVNVVSTIGVDYFDGGAGIDLIDWSDASETGATFDLTAGTATDVLLNVETMINFENLSGTGNADTIIGTTGINALSGQGGNDIINGGAAGDTLDGGAGRDELHGDDGDDRLILNFGDELFGTEVLDGGTGLIVWLSNQARARRSMILPRIRLTPWKRWCSALLLPVVTVRSFSMPTSLAAGFRRRR
jgi:subtilisin-like proprotein convertase family protein